VSDLIAGILALSRSEIHTPVNIGNDIEWTILECAHEVLAVTGADVPIIRKPLPQDDPMRRRPDLTLARTKLDWPGPTIMLREGLERSLSYFRACLGIETPIATNS
jgi:dTDP-glucose 4,6-dehydratase